MLISILIVHDFGAIVNGGAGFFSDFLHAAAQEIAWAKSGTSIRNHHILCPKPSACKKYAMLQYSPLEIRAQT
jgi:hypothetical protein